MDNTKLISWAEAARAMSMTPVSTMVESLHETMLFGLYARSQEMNASHLITEPRHFHIIARLVFSAANGRRLKKDGIWIASKTADVIETTRWTTTH